MLLLLKVRMITISRVKVGKHIPTEISRLSTSETPFDQTIQSCNSFMLTFTKYPCSHSRNIISNLSTEKNLELFYFLSYFFFFFCITFVLVFCKRAGSHNTLHTVDSLQKDNFLKGLFTSVSCQLHYVTGTANFIHTDRELSLLNSTANRTGTSMSSRFP